MSLALIAAKQSPPNSRMRSGKRGAKGDELQVGAVLVDDRFEVVDAEERAAFGDERVAAGQFVAQHRAERLGHARFELEPDHPAPPPPLDRVGEVADEVLGLFLDLDIAVAQHAELGGAADRVAGEDDRREALHQRFDRDVARRLARQADEARHRRGQHHQLADFLAVRRADQVEDHRQPLVGHERERMRGIERLRGQDREDLVAEMVFEPRRVVGADRFVDLARSEHVDAGVGQIAAQVAPDAALILDQRVGAGDDRGAPKRRVLDGRALRAEV